MADVFFQEKILQWWRENGRVLPWREKISPRKNALKKSDEKIAVQGVRENIFSEYFASSLYRDPYRVVVSELMLQQTQVERVLPKYLAWMKKWPTVQDLAKATLADVLIFWQGLGYNRRARFLWLMAREITDHHAGSWPKAEDELRALPGIGKYTARALQAFAFGMQVGVVDTNVQRILQRWANTFTHTDKEIFALADAWLPPTQADPWNQALMDFGALICTALAPKCTTCPVQSHCLANLQSQSEGFTYFADQLSAERQQKKSTTQTPKQKFTDSDRYFRGRIVDALRTKHMTYEALWQLLQSDHGLHDQSRFAQLMKTLLKEKILTQRGKQFFLGE